MKRKLLVALLSLFALTPAMVRAETGQRLEITTDSAVQGPDAKAILHALLGDATAEKSQRRVEVKLLNQGSYSTLFIEVHGVAFPSDAAERLRSMFPALKTAQIAIVATDGSQPPLPPLPPEPGDLSTPEQIAAFKAKVEAQLKAEGKTGTVEVIVQTGADGKKQVKVEVKAETEK